MIIPQCNVLKVVINIGFQTTTMDHPGGVRRELITIGSSARQGCSINPEYDIRHGADIHGGPVISQLTKAKPRVSSFSFQPCGVLMATNGISPVVQPPSAQPFQPQEQLERGIGREKKILH